MSPVHSQRTTLRKTGAGTVRTVLQLLDHPSIVLDGNQPLALGDVDVLRVAAARGTREPSRQDSEALRGAPVLQIEEGVTGRRRVRDDGAADRTGDADPGREPGAVDGRDRAEHDRRRGEN